MAAQDRDRERIDHLSSVPRSEGAEVRQGRGLVITRPGHRQREEGETGHPSEQARPGELPPSPARRSGGEADHRQWRDADNGGDEYGGAHCGERQQAAVFESAQRAVQTAAFPERIRRANLRASHPVPRHADSNNSSLPAVCTEDRGSCLEPGRRLNRPSPPAACPSLYVGTGDRLRLNTDDPMDLALLRLHLDHARRVHLNPCRLSPP